MFLNGRKIKISIYPRPHDKQTVYLKDVITNRLEALRRRDCDEEKIKRNIPIVQSGDIAASEHA